MTLRALVTGAGGLIGNYLVKTAHRWAPGWNIVGLARSDFDLTDTKRLDSYWLRDKPDLVIHCAAVSRISDCERDPDHAQRVNVRATAHLAKLAEAVPFIFLSSADVFDGKKGRYEESDNPVPLSVYGRTKLDAERIVLQNPRHTVLRIVLTAGVSVRADRSFVEEMSRTAQAGKPITLYTDEFRCPLPAGVIARIVWEVVGRDRPGLYHVAGSERLSRWEIGDLLSRWYPELQGRLVAGSARTHLGVPRPADLSLRCEKLQRMLSFRIPGFREWLDGRAGRGRDLWDYERG
ncbi:putative dTDP-4-dehydrorhamnose reductase [Nitrospira sp. KM1]|uniref:SDR family oxidoreductase n=1 Tax=Nitrospira sp. KM1 TaxID=1936990 RepID=UPI0013A7804E|nr:SDR family oxidoreductase [Nitrospira sp. KM1]BCA55216.1 putative dTDP-4-dehydrorhamnose reductase [Nitrospira sp. KM1]